MKDCRYNNRRKVKARLIRLSWRQKMLMIAVCKEDRNIVEKYLVTVYSFGRRGYLLKIHDRAYGNWSVPLNKLNPVGTYFEDDLQFSYRIHFITKEEVAYYEALLAITK